MNNNKLEILGKEKLNKNFFKKGKVDFKYSRLFNMSEENVINYMTYIASSNGYKKPYEVDIKKEFLYIKGEIPIMLVAHVDTVVLGTPALQHDETRNILWSSKNGLGADDRAGVAAIIEIITSGLKPHILLCDGEELGCVGARSVVKNIGAPEVKYIIDLDRRGDNDAVFYDCDNPEFEQYIENFGFKSSYGTFTDISVLSPYWGIAGVNLSIGYYDAHTKDEYLKINEWQKTVDKLKIMLKNPPSEQFKYIEKKYPLYTYKTSFKDYYDVYDYEEDDYYSSVKVTAEDLASYLGGNKQDWELWLLDNKEFVEEIIFTVIEDYICGHPPKNME